MLQQFGRKKSSSLNQQLIVGGACIIHHKINQSKRFLLHQKTDKTDKPLYNFSSDPLEDCYQRVNTFKKISSSQKNKIILLKNIFNDKLFKENSSNSSKQKNKKSIFKNKNIYSSGDQFFKQDDEILDSQKKRFKKKLQILSTQNDIKKQFLSQKSPTKLQRRILPQITQKFRSNTTSSSKKQLNKKLFFDLCQQNNYESTSKIKKEKINQEKLKILPPVEDEQKKYRLPRNNTTKVQRSQYNQLFEKKNGTKLKSISASSGTKQIKRDFQSFKQIKMNDQQSHKYQKQQKSKQKNTKFNVIRDQFTSIINQTNEIQVINQTSLFNAFIQKGNNGILVKQLIKKRWWWHFSDQNPKDQVIDNTACTKENSSIPQPVIANQKKKINLYWSEWLNKGFVQKLQIPNDNPINLKTIYDQFQSFLPQQQQKYQSVKKITDQQTFTAIKDKISLRNVNYFKNHFPKPIKNDIQSDLFLKSGKTQDISLKFKNRTKQDRLNFFKRVQLPHEMKIHNHVIGCLQLHSKKLLFKNFSSYLKKKNMNPFEFIPLTFYIEDMKSENYLNFLHYHQKFRNKQNQGKSQSIWILKPGQNSNRGFGISIHKQKQQIQGQLIKRLNFKQSNEEEDSSTKKVKKSVIVQKYIEKCFLINNRKFDFRCYILITTANGFLKGYWYGNGYIRTSSEEYNLNDIQNRMIHLTNDAVQSKNSSFGKFEDYNKLSFQGFIKYLEKQNIPQKKFDDALKRMKNIAYYLIASVSQKIKRYQYTFELFGLDFMLDQNLNPFLIEANSNPCLDTKGPILTKIIRNLVENVIMTAIDPLFPPPKNIVTKKKKQQLDKDYFESNMFQLIFTDKKAFELQNDRLTRQQQVLIN